MDDAARLSPPVINSEFSTAELSSTDSRTRNKDQIDCPEEVVRRGPYGGCMPYLSYLYTGIGGAENGEKKQKEEDENAKVLKHILESRMNVDDLITKLNTVDLIEQVLFEDDENQRSLAPLVLFNATKKKLALKKQQEMRRNSAAEENAFSGNKIKSKHNQKNITNSDGVNHQEEQESFENIYKSLEKLHKDSGGSFKSAVKAYMLENREEVFEGNNSNQSNKGAKKGSREANPPPSVNSEVVMLNRDRIELKFYLNKQAEAELKPGEELAHQTGSKGMDDSILAMESPSTYTGSSKFKMRSVRSSLLKRGEGSQMGSQRKSRFVLKQRQNQN